MRGIWEGNRVPSFTKKGITNISCLQVESRQNLSKNKNKVLKHKKYEEFTYVAH